MSTGINFAPGSHEHSKHGKGGDIEYSSGEGDEPKPQPQKPVTPPPQQLAQQPAPATPEKPSPSPIAIAKPKKAHAFFSWRKKRDEESTQRIAQHAAPQHHKENATTDLLHGVVGVAEQKKPAPHVSGPVSARASLPLTPTSQPAPTPEPAPKVAPVAVQPTPQPVPIVQIRQQVAQKLSRKEQKERLVDELPVTEVNLIPDVVLSGMEKSRSARDLGYIALSLLAVILAIYGGLKIYERKITTDTVAVESDINTLNQQIAAYQDTQSYAQDVSDQLIALDRVMQAHVYWTPFLNTIEDLTLPTVYYTSMTGSASSLSFTFDAVAESYSQIAPQVESFRQSLFVTSVNISSTQMFEPSTVISSTPTAPEAVGGVSFKMTVEFAPEVFIHPQLRSYAQN